MWNYFDTFTRVTLPGPEIPRVMQIASRIENDIRSRQLRPGDPYLNTEEVSRLFSINKSTVNRAMQLLAKRHLVLRRQRRGVVIADGIVQATQIPLRRIHLLVHQNYLKTEGTMSDGVLIGLQTALPGIDVGVNFLSPGDDADKVNDVIAGALRSPDPEGFILVRASLAVQRLIQSVGLPAVVYGSLYPSVHNLSWIDFDQRQSSRLLVKRILEQGHRRVLYLGRDRVFPGDYLFQDSMIETLAEAGLPMSALTIRHLPADHELIKTEVCALLGRDSAAVRADKPPSHPAWGSLPERNRWPTERWRPWSRWEWSSAAT